MRFFSRIKIILKLFVTRGRVGLGGGDGVGMGWEPVLGGRGPCRQIHNVQS